MERRSIQIKYILARLHLYQEDNCYLADKQLRNGSQVVTASAEEMSENMNTVAAASELALSNVQMVAAASEEMTANIYQIAGNAEKSREVTKEAVLKAKKSSISIHCIGESAESVGKITETINEISEQTNLLALNGTIEADRAGEVGKGFVVVANEIKDLAEQAADATRDIRNRIEGMQTSTRNAVVKITQIEGVITNIKKNVSTIASAVEEQSSATQEIEGNVSQAARGIQDVNENVAQGSVFSGYIAKKNIEVDKSATKITDGSRSVIQSAQDLSRLACLQLFRFFLKEYSFYES